VLSVVAPAVCAAARATDRRSGRHHQASPALARPGQAADRRVWRSLRRGCAWPDPSLPRRSPVGAPGSHRPTRGSRRHSRWPG
jgi:hypothetical protein